MMSRLYICCISFASLIIPGIVCVTQLCAVCTDLYAGTVCRYASRINKQEWRVIVTHYAFLIVEFIYLFI